MSDFDFKRFIKSPCGRAKYKELAERKGLIPTIRKGWFVIFATIRDIRLPNDQQL
tara:strand:- start:700 stop:864 length:165 start_codon:yes stop_codon:yes gene_type:complete